MSESGPDADGNLGDPIALACGVCSVGVSREREAARTDGQSYVFLLVWGEAAEGDGLTSTAMTGAEARELAARLLLAADLCP